MLVDTAVLGQVEVASENVFHMPDGLYGFETLTEFALITKTEDNVTLRWFQAVDATVPCFVVFDPNEIVSGFEPVVDEADLKQLGCANVSELSFLVIAVVPENMTDMTVNLKSPIALNRKAKRARQVILTNKDYPIKYPLFPKNEADTTDGV